MPVPCASTTSTSALDSRALASAARMTRCCDGPFGAVRPLEAPSWLIAEPRITASTLCPLRRASSRRSSTTMPTPSDMPMPSASAENALHRPSSASPRCREKPMNPDGDMITVTPPATASVHSPARSAWAARCNATSDDEQAVSTDTAGPCSPSR
ncbi:hypothetical protein GCM10010434_073410 [Winogradskya humida]